MGIRFFADMHSHPQGRSFNYFRNNPERIGQVESGIPIEWSPWVLPPRDGMPKNWRRQLAGKRPGCFAQSDFNRLAAGNVRLVFASLYPLEGGFVRGKSQTGFGKIAHAVLKPISLLAERNDLRALAMSLQMRYSIDRIRFFQGKTKEIFDYWEETKLEYYFLAARDGIKQTHTFNYFAQECVDTPLDENGFPDQEHEEYQFKLDHQYEIVQSKTHLSRVLDEHGYDNKTIAVVLTIEGGHVFSMGRDDTMLDWETIQSRLLELKNWGKRLSGRAASADDLKNVSALKKWIEQAEGVHISHPVFIINLSHHFNNYLAAHARSLPDKLRLLMDQSPGMINGLAVTDIGRNVIELCLGIRRVVTHDSVRFEKTNFGKRILIDVKHMNPRARAVYYDDYIIPYNIQFPEDRIPVIATHVGVVGATYLTLAELKKQEIVSLAEDLVKRNTSREGFTLWGINMCLEDMRIICQSAGIIALSIDQRILGNPSGKSGAADFVRNLKYIIEESKKHRFVSEQADNSVWDCISVASDFDGFIDPIESCPSVMHYDNLLIDVKALVRDYSEEFFKPYTLDQCMEKLFGLNAFNFVKTHFPA
jgi:hypothetical protein